METFTDRERIDWLHQLIGYDEVRIRCQDDRDNPIQVVAQGWCFAGKDVRQALDRALLHPIALPKERNAEYIAELTREVERLKRVLRNSINPNVQSKETNAP